MTEEQISVLKEIRIQFVCPSYTEMGRELFLIRSSWHWVD